MLQFFLAVNQSKQEYFSALGFDSSAGFWTWCTGNHAGLLAYLIRKSDDFSTCGDIGRLHTVQYAGRWAGDPIFVVGDHDSSELYGIASRSYTDIAKGLVAEFNQFIGVEERIVRYRPMLFDHRE